jgi:DNA-binding GntR family transcriptional regulator
MPRKPNVAEAYAPEDFPIDRKLPVAEQLYRIIRQRIVELSLAPGAPISDSAIALAAGISRTPVRESFERLEDENLIVVYPSQGSFITKISVARVEEAIFLREMLEPEVTARCAMSADRGALLGALGQMTDRHRHAVEVNGGARVYGLDEAFHKALFDACGLTMSWSAVSIARGQMDRIHYLGKLSDLVPRRALIQHLDIVKAIRDGDADIARARMLSHVQSNRDILAKSYKIRREYFEDA